MADSSTPTGVLLVNLGTPDHPDVASVRRYLKDFLSDPRVVDYPRWLWYPLLYGVILPLRSRKVAKLYRSIWMAEGSPLRHYTLSLASQVGDALGSDYKIEAAMTYGQPDIASALDRLQGAGCQRVLVLPLYPQYSCSTTAAVFDAVAQALKPRRLIPALQLFREYYQHPGYIDVLADSVQAYWRQHGQGERLLCSFHGIPERYVNQGDPYRQHCEQTAELLRQKLGLSAEQMVVSFQSRVGKETWLQPYTDATLAQLGQQGIKRIDALCPAFAVDCLETLEEIAEEGKAIFTEAGGESLHYIPALNDQPGHVEFFAQLVRQLEGSAASGQ